MSILTDMEMRTILNNTKITRTKLGNGKIALAFYLNDQNTNMIIKEFTGEYQLRKFIYEAIVLRCSVNPNKAEGRKIVHSLKAMFKFLLDKKDLNDEKII